MSRLFEKGQWVDVDKAGELLRRLPTGLYTNVQILMNVLIFLVLKKCS